MTDSPDLTPTLPPFCPNKAETTFVRLKAPFTSRCGPSGHPPPNHCGGGWMTGCDMGSSELALALQEWPHWLEGSVQPFSVWTDHKNLAFLRCARRLNS